MRILYITPLVMGFEDLLRGKSESHGLPSFIFPLKELITRGHIVDIILVSNYKDPIDIKVDWISAKNIIANINNDLVEGSRFKRKYNKIKSFFALLRILGNCLRSGDYDFVYCHGKAGFLGNLFANAHNIPCGYRVYGTIDMAENIRRKGLLKTAIKYPVYFAIFNTKKCFLMVTDDGTEGNFVYKKFSVNKSYDFQFMLNGIEKEIDYHKCEIEIPKGRYLYHAGRIARQKGQHRVVKITYALHKMGIKVKVYFSGHVSEPEYKAELDALVKKYHLADYVIFLGDIKREDLQNLARNALAVTLYANFNQGNVFFECMMSGGVIVTKEEESLHRFIQNGRNGFFANNLDDAVSVIMKLNSMTEDEILLIRNNATKRVERSLLTWEERVAKEVNLIEAYGRKR